MDVGLDVCARIRVPSLSVLSLCLPLSPSPHSLTISYLCVPLAQHYTGAHRHRFDDSGIGKGVHGRDAVRTGKGHTGRGTSHRGGDTSRSAQPKSFDSQTRNDGVRQRDRQRDRQMKREQRETERESRVEREGRNPSL